MEPSPAFFEAQAIVAVQPLPANAYERLAALEKEIRPDEVDRFGDLWEAYMAGGGHL